MAKHMPGVLPSTPFHNFVSNPLGAVTKKKSGKWKLILHLSYPSGASVNDGIDITGFPLHYHTVYDAMGTVMQLSRGAIMDEVDIKRAFLLNSVHPSDHLMGMK